MGVSKMLWRLGIFEFLVLGGSEADRSSHWAVVD
jgi:hypothetical protein